jgi:hypothetical protein
MRSHRTERKRKNGIIKEKSALARREPAWDFVGFGRVDQIDRLYNRLALMTFSELSRQSQKDGKSRLFLGRPVPD